MSVQAKRYSYDYGSTHVQYHEQQPGRALQAACGGSMVDVLSKRSSQNSCVRISAWGILTYGTATVCASHENCLLDGLLINANYDVTGY